MTLPGRFLRRPGRASAPVMMMVPPVRVGMGTGGGRGGTGPIRADAAQPEDTAAGRLRSQRRHFLRKQAESLLLDMHFFFYSCVSSTVNHYIFRKFDFNRGRRIVVSEKVYVSIIYKRRN